MKKILLLTVAAALAACLSGCCGVTVTKAQPTLVAIETSGCFLFGGIPLFTGDPDYPNNQVCCWFKNNVKLETNVRLLREEAATRHARDIRNVVSSCDSESVLWFIIKRKIYRTSAELVK